MTLSRGGKERDGFTAAIRCEYGCTRDEHPRLCSCEFSAAEIRGWPTAGELLEAIERLLHWRRLSINENQGGAWFYDAQGMGTKSVDPFDIRRLYEEEAKARGYERI